MNVLDENILESQRQLLRGWRVPVRQIGHELAHKGVGDFENRKDAARSVLTEHRKFAKLIALNAAHEYHSL